MIVGILSDSHGHAEAVRSAVEILRRHGAEMLFHCGDLGGVEVLDELVGLPVHFVWGNMDRPDGATYAYCETVGLPWPNGPVEVEVAGKRIGVYHGHEFLRGVRVEPGRFDYVFFGHTHQREDVQRDGTRFINPGALHRASTKTVATLDLATDALTYFRVPDGDVVMQ